MIFGHFKHRLYLIPVSSPQIRGKKRVRAEEVVASSSTAAEFSPQVQRPRITEAELSPKDKKQMMRLSFIDQMKFVEENFDTIASNLRNSGVPPQPLDYIVISFSDLGDLSCEPAASLRFRFSAMEVDVQTSNVEQVQDQAQHVLQEHVDEPSYATFTVSLANILRDDLPDETKQLFFEKINVALIDMSDFTTSSYTIRIEKCYLKLFVTNFENMWKNKKIINKLLNKLLDVLLKIHLAPIRETKYREMVEAKKQESENKQKQKEETLEAHQYNIDYLLRDYRRLII
ncbi:hypothetical protein G6F70_000499 [Rhizopus microsporus]|nr:hypothetical protein G6F71_008040 [Rhizopus microsporus]KAG1204375.1 hypothetical protein G6F70_000499 [Rhizopus microsporus]KAG1209485.1 hypothetical protein G6F69_006311 [Rhizopus microsporus]KAG1231277.1 hypothetical protein G6F67_005871 [Rhizopus microsporus]KAG1269384.1 hypothetical protein G6F68_000291 [Rhizopus microsporus]